MEEEERGREGRGEVGSSQCWCLIWDYVQAFDSRARANVINRRMLYISK